MKELSESKKPNYREIRSKIYKIAIEDLGFRGVLYIDDIFNHLLSEFRRIDYEDYQKIPGSVKKTYQEAGEVNR